MGSMDSAFGGNFEGNFEPDEFYESFLAPKFHDFTAPEEPIDPDAYFMAKPGMLKKAFAIDEVKPAAPKIHKIAAVDVPKTATVIQQHAPPKSPVAVEKAAVSAGSAKKATRVVTAAVSPLTSKSLKNGNSATNSPAQLPMVEKNSNGSLKPTSLAKKLQASENDDPNSPTNNSPDVAPKSTIKPALTRQRSVKAHEDKPTLTRQRSLKLPETKPTTGAVDAHAARKVSGESCESKSSKSSSDKERDQGKPKQVATINGGAGAVKVVSSAVATCKTPVKEPASNQQEVKKPVSCAEVAGSPYSGHHCKSSRCAANDPNFSSPVPTKKYLIAKRGTPGSLRKTTPSHAGGEKCNEEVSAEGHKDNEENQSSTSSVEEADADASKDNSNAKVALEDVFQKMALDESLVLVEKVISVTAVTKLSKFEVEDLKEVPLSEAKTSPPQTLSAEDVRAWAGRSVDLEEKTATSSERSKTDTEKCTDSEPKATGVNQFLKVASECLENIDLNKLDIPQSKQGKKRKSGELMPAGASKRANCTSDDTRIKAISKKISQIKEAAASKVPNKLNLRRVSVARRLSIARPSTRVTNPRPFRLRTQERGAIKEKEFIKKVEEYKAAKEGFNSAFQGLAVAEPKIPAKFLKSGHVFSAKRADPNPKNDAEAKALKPGVLAAQKAPLFDHPFKPHRSTKKLTVPQEPKFHTKRGGRTCPSHTVAVLA